MKKSDEITKPSAFMAGLFLLIALSSIMTLFGSVVAESIVHGVSVYYISLAACALLGAGLAVCYLSGYFGLVMSKRYPSRFTTPIIITVALIDVVIHSALLEVFRDNVEILYIVYLVVSVAMAILYLMLEPHLLYSFRNRTLQDIIGVVAEDRDDDEPVKPETVSAAAHVQKRPPRREP